jgi:hypothetical protein
MEKEIRGLNGNINNKRSSKRLSLSINLQEPRQTLLKQLINIWCKSEIANYIHHTKIYLIYDEEEALVFVFKSYIIITCLFEEQDDTKEFDINPIIYNLKYESVIYKYFTNFYRFTISK